MKSMITRDKTDQWKLGVKDLKRRDRMAEVEKDEEKIRNSVYFNFIGIRD